MAKYFDYFGNYITYKGRKVIDITKRSKIIEEIRSNPYVFLPYTVKGNEKPEDIAHFYYEDVNKTWLVYFSNNVIDPYFDWVLDDENFHEYLIKKYSVLSGEEGNKVIEWTQNETITDNIVHAVDVDDDAIKISKNTYLTDDTLVVSNWRPIRIYEYEEIKNENKRQIRLVNRAYAEQVESDLRESLSQ